jgi:hypothetical protein
VLVSGQVLAEYLSFIIMVPLAIVSWRAIAAIFLNRDPGSRVGAVIGAIT